MRVWETFPPRQSSRVEGSRLQIGSVDRFSRRNQAERCPLSTSWAVERATSLDCFSSFHSKLLVRDLASCRSPGAGPFFLNGEMFSNGEIAWKSRPNVKSWSARIRFGSAMVGQKITKMNSGIKHCMSCGKGKTLRHAHVRSSHREAVLVPGRQYVEARSFLRNGPLGSSVAAQASRCTIADRLQGRC